MCHYWNDFTNSHGMNTNPKVIGHLIFEAHHYYELFSRICCVRRVNHKLQDILFVVPFTYENWKGDTESTHSDVNRSYNHHRGGERLNTIVVFLTFGFLTDIGLHGWQSTHGLSIFWFFLCFCCIPNIIHCW